MTAGDVRRVLGLRLVGEYGMAAAERLVRRPSLTVTDREGLSRQRGWTWLVSARPLTLVRDNSELEGFGVSVGRVGSRTSAKVVGGTRRQ